MEFPVAVTVRIRLVIALQIKLIKEISLSCRRSFVVPDSFVRGFTFGFLLSLLLLGVFDIQGKQF